MGQKLDTKKGFWIYAIILTAMILATPLFAGVINTFSPGETISSAAVNQNFSELQSQIDEICNQQGQVLAQGIINGLDGTKLPGFSSCNDAMVTSERLSEGLYELTIEGINPEEDVTIQVTPRITNPRICSAGTATDRFTVHCFDLSGGASNSSFFLSVFRR